MANPNDQTTTTTTTTTPTPNTTSGETVTPAAHPSDVAAPLDTVVNDHHVTVCEASVVITAERLDTAVPGAAQTETRTPEASQGKHPKKELPSCDVCLRRFNSTASLKLHMRYHSDKPKKGRVPPPFKKNKKSVQKRVDPVPENTAEREIIDLMVGDGSGLPPAHCKIEIDLNLPPPNEDDDVMMIAWEVAT